MMAMTPAADFVSGGEHLAGCASSPADGVAHARGEEVPPGRREGRRRHHPTVRNGPPSGRQYRWTLVRIVEIYNFFLFFSFIRTLCLDCLLGIETKIIMFCLTLFRPSAIYIQK